MKIEPEQDPALRQELIAAVKEKGYCFYSDLYAKFGVDPEIFDEKTSVAQALARLNEAEAAEERPLLGAVVIERTTMIPAKSFFDQARQMGRYLGPLTGDKAQRFHDQEMKRIAEFWKSRQIGDVFSKTAAADKRIMPRVTAPRTVEELALTWDEPVMDGAHDLFSLNIFAAAVAGAPHEHRRTPAKGATVTAKFLLTVVGRTATLDYAAFAEENRAVKVAPGTLTLTFRDEDRIAVSSASWMPTGGREITIRLKQGAVLPASLPPYAPADEDQADPDPAGPVVFRRRLRVAYADRCCITGCDVVEALDAAHIDPYRNPTQNHPVNGLLLRKDLRALLDAGLLAIDPLSRTVFLATRARSHPDYNGLDGRKLREPIHGFSAYAPDAQALTRKWKSFQAHGAGTTSTPLAPPRAPAPYRAPAAPLPPAVPPPDQDLPPTARPYAPRPYTPRPPQDDRPFDRRPPRRDRPDDRRPAGDRPYPRRPSGPPSGGRPWTPRPPGDRPTGSRPPSDRPRGDRPYGSRPPGGRPPARRGPGGRPGFGRRPGPPRPPRRSE